MTRKDYQLIAKALNRAATMTDITPEALFGITLAVGALSLELERDNPRFDSKRFAEACYQGR